MAMTYRAFCIHGKVRAMVVDDVGTKDLVCESLGEWPKWAHHIDHVTVEEARKSDMVCPICDPRLAKTQQETLFEAAK